MRLGRYIAFAPLAGLLLFSPSAKAHNPINSHGQEFWAALLTALLLFGFWGLYLMGSRRTIPSTWRSATFHLTALLCAMAVLGPLDEWAKTSTAAHMVQHMLLMVVITPLWVICRPLPQLNTATGGQLTGVFSATLHLAARPLSAAYLHGVVIWFWHVPVFYMLAVDNAWWHALEHATFLFTAGVFWWSVLHAGNARTPAALLALLFTLMHTGFLGALLTFARAPFYGEARDLADQQLAGLIMWVAGAIPYLLASAWIGHRWFQRLSP